MPTATETEKYAEWHYIVRKWVTDRAIATSKQIQSPKGKFWVSQRNDRFGRFDVIAINPSDGRMHLVQVSRGEEWARKHRTAIKKWWNRNCFSERALSHIKIFVFVYVGRPRKHFETWSLVVEDEKVKWVRRLDADIPKKEEVDLICDKMKRHRR